LQHQATPSRAAVVDDDRLLRELVRRTLEAHGYDVVEGENGAAGLRLAQSKPDVMVLDLNLPDMSGLAVCRAIRGGAATEGVPVVFLTASDDEKTIVSCLESGASDYVSKPFAPSVLAARVEAVVRTHKAELARRKHTDELAAAYAALGEARAEMVLQHRLTGLGVLAAGVAHEMNSPLGALIASLQFAAREQGPERDAAIEDALTAAQRIAELVKRMRAIAGSGERSVRRVDLRARAEQICEAFASSHAELTIEGPALSVHAVDSEVREVLTALIENAVQATHSTPNARVLVELRRDADGVVVVVDDNGPGIDAADLPFLFDPFFTRKRVWKTTGLGLAIAQAAARRHGGEITVEARGPLGGARVRLRLPEVADTNAVGDATALLAELRSDR
jgi:signal transduction histidine kinase